ncbi:MAG: class I SAM-dependent methyltransferase [Spirochaetes bacterium]|nr:MAG: class I SAM-dependent methyltransferase [Spirochaetota bacterium]
MPEAVPCILCGSARSRTLFTKPSGDGEPFTLAACRDCGLRFVSPRPSPDEIARYYEKQYFTTRTARGYDNYFSPAVRGEIERVIALNLRDAGFFPFEESLAERRALDIGCAAGYFVNYLAARGWDACGIDVSDDCVNFARESLKLDVTRGSYLDARYDRAFQLVTLWATIEHLHHPERFMEKIRAELAPGGRLYITTCREGVLNFKSLYGPAWRFYNFPEHLYFFSFRTLKRLLVRHGFRVRSYATYGSGFGRGGSLPRRAADFLAKNLYMGDMMLVAAEKANGG